MAENSKENITLRFSKQLLDKMRQEADQQNVSLNTIAQRVVSEHYDWHVNAAKAGMIPIHKSSLALMLDKISEEEIIKIAEFFAEVRVKEILLILRNDYSLDSFLDIFESWLKVSSMLYGKEFKNHGKSYSYVIQHELGKKWSLFLSTMVRSVLEKMEIKKTNFELTENAVMFDISIESIKSYSAKS